jgi:hypothetical protein
MTQPNFLSVTRSLKAAIAFCETHPQLQSSRTYAELLQDRAGRFSRSTLSTDGSYTAWREAVGAELKQLRLLRVELARVMELLDEHGFDDLPDRRVLYTERNDLFLLADETLAILRTNASEWSWMSERMSAIAGLKTACDEKASAADVLLNRYRAGVTARVDAYEMAVKMVTEYLRDAHADATDRDGLKAVTLVQL